MDMLGYACIPEQTNNRCQDACIPKETNKQANKQTTKQTNKQHGHVRMPVQLNKQMIWTSQDACIPKQTNKQANNMEKLGCLYT